MGFKPLVSNTLLLFGMLIICTSCKSQNQPDKPSEPEAVAVTGMQVSNLTSGATVIFQDSQNNYWFGGGELGVYRFDGKRLLLFTTEDGLIDTRILGIQEDQYGHIYFDTTEGVSKFDGKKFTTLEVKENSLSENDWKLDPDDLWFRMGWDHDGPFRYDGQYLHSLKLPETEQAAQFFARHPNAPFNPYGIYSLYQDTKGHLWFGTSSLGVCRFDGNSLDWLYEDQMTNVPGGGALGIRSTLEDKEGYYWFTHTKYRYKILPGSFERNGTNYLNYTKEIGTGHKKQAGKTYFPYFMSIAEDQDGHLWMVTYENGVWRNNGQELIHYPIMDGETKVLLFSIYKDNLGALWLGTHNAGVYKFSGEVFEKFEP